MVGDAGDGVKQLLFLLVRSAFERRRPQRQKTPTKVLALFEASCRYLSG
jgi:hypothetical protein